MSKNIVVITGSPRKGGNSDLLAEAFIAAAEGKGHSVRRFDAARMNIAGCRACNGCYKTGKPCVIDDDFNEIATAVLGADAVIFSVPTYWFSAPSGVKAVLDRFYSFMVGGKLEELAGKKAGLIACCMSEKLSTMEPTKLMFETAFSFIKWEHIGTVLVPKVGNPGDVKNTDGCSRAAALADLL